jgi:hypothetical protein
MKKYLFSCGVAVLLSLSAAAQNEQDVLRYSRLGFGGTARYASMGGAFGALGGDISIININPAGLGMYRKNDLVLSTSFFNQRVESSYADTLTSDERFNVKVDGFGFVIAAKPENRTDHGWQMLSMAIGYNRTNSFQSDQYMQGNQNSSMMDSWVRSASGTGPSMLDPFNEGLAWNTYLLDPAGNDTLHYVDRIPDGDIVTQVKQIETRGGMGEWTFGAAGNYDNRIYIGAAIGVPRVNYEETVFYSETELNDTVSNFDYLQFEQYLETKGRGINFRAGVIFRPYDFMRVGVAFTSPTSLKLTDTYFSKMTSILGDTLRVYESPNGNYRYTIRTPMRLTGSLAFVIYKFALFSVDYEYVDYSDGRLKSVDYNYFEENNAVRAKYTSASNIRTGLEVKFAPFSFRAGFAYYGSPYQPNVKNEAARTYITGGVGYRDPDDVFYIDLGIISQRYTENYYFYDQSLVEPVVNKWKSINVLLTIGLRFGQDPEVTD